MQQRVETAIHIDFDEPLPISFVSQLRDHLFQIGELSTQSSVKRFRVYAPGDRICSRSRIAVDRNAAALEPRLSGKAGNTSTFVSVNRIALIGLTALLYHRREVTAYDDDESVNLSQNDFDGARKTAFAQIGDQRFQQHVAGR